MVIRAHLWLSSVAILIQDKNAEKNCTAGTSEALAINKGLQ